MKRSKRPNCMSFFHQDL